MRRPSDLQRTPLRDILAGWYDASETLAFARAGMSRAPAAQLRAAALTALLTAAALAEGVTAERWLVVAQALSLGATVDQIAAAAGLRRAELVVGMRRWLDGQARQGRATPAEVEATLALIGGAR